MLNPDPLPAIATVDDIKAELYDRIYEQTNGVVQDGPFKGIQIYPDRSWGASNIAAELLGFHEQELHEDIEKQIARLLLVEAPTVVNVGCAEGYYAVGLGYRLPKASVYAFDIDERSAAITTKNAENNRVKLTIGSVEEAFAHPDLIVMDCEGAERSYLDPDLYPGLKGATIIFELHPAAGDERPLSDVIYERFSPTHTCRNPNESPLLWGCSSFVRWLAVCESRPCLMTWGILTPKGESR